MNYKRYQKLQKYYMGRPVFPAEYKKGNLISTENFDSLYDCEHNIKWVLVDGYICEEITDGEVQYWTPLTWSNNYTNNYGEVFIREKLIISNNGGKTFTDSSPLQTRITNISAGLTQTFTVEYIKKYVDGLNKYVENENVYLMYEPNIITKNENIKNELKERLPDIDVWNGMNFDFHTYYTWSDKKTGCHNDHTQYFQNKIEHTSPTEENELDELRWCEVLPLKISPCTPIYNDHDVIIWKPKSENYLEVLDDLIEENGIQYIKIYKFINNIITNEYKKGNVVQPVSSSIHYLWETLSFPENYICEDGKTHEKNVSSVHWIVNQKRQIEFFDNDEEIYRIGQVNNTLSICEEPYIYSRATAIPTSNTYYPTWYLVNRDSNFLNYANINVIRSSRNPIWSTSSNKGFVYFNRIKVEQTFEVHWNISISSIFNDDLMYNKSLFYNCATPGGVIDFSKFLKYYNNINDKVLNWFICPGNISYANTVGNDDFTIVVDGLDLTDWDLTDFIRVSDFTDYDFKISALSCNETTIQKLTDLYGSERIIV